MIARLTVENGKFTVGFVRKGECKLIIKDSTVEWPQKWQITLRPDSLFATSFRNTKGGSNVLEFEVNLNGVAKLWLRTTAGEKRTIYVNRIFEHQNNLDGNLYLIYNSNGYRYAYFFPKEFIDWKKDHGIANVVAKNPNAVQFRDRRANQGSRAVRMGELSVYNFGKLIAMTDGEIILNDVPRFNSETRNLRFICFRGASWVVLDKVRTTRTERVLITERPVFELQLPETKFEQIRKCSIVGLGLLSQAKCEEAAEYTL